MAESLKVLLVDDEPETIRLLRKVLQADGCQVLEAVDGQEALTLFARESPDLILLDIILPQIDGIEVLKRIRSQDPITGIIMVSALTSEKLAVEAMLAGADDYVSKPFPLKEIRVRIQQTADKVWLRRENLRLQHELEATKARLQQLTARSPFSATSVGGVPSAQGSGEHLEITVLFAALRGLSQFTESLPPERFLHLLNHYLSAAIEAVLEERGTLGGVTGHTLMAFFNAPVRQEDHALRAVRAALKVREKAQRARTADEVNDLPVHFCFGIHTDAALVGNLGFAQHSVYTAVGRAESLAHQLLSFAQPGQIIIGERTLALVREYVDVSPLEAVDAEVDGYTKSMRLFNVLRLR